MDSIDFKQQIYCSFLRMGVAQKTYFVFFHGRHNCMIPNVKKVTFLALVSVFTS